MPDPGLTEAGGTGQGRGHNEWGHASGQWGVAL